MQAGIYKISSIVPVLVLIIFLLLHAKKHENIRFLDDNFIRMIRISYERFLTCDIQLLVPDSESEMNLFSIKCNTDYYISIMTILLFLSYIIYKVLCYTHFICKPFIFVILRVIITIILIISLPETVSKCIVLEFILEFRLVSLFYGFLFIILRLILSESLSIFGMVPTQTSGPVLI